MGQREQPLDLRRQRLGVALRQLAADLADERRRRIVLEREIRQLRAKLAIYEPSDAGSATRATDEGDPRRGISTKPEPARSFHDKIGVKSE